MFFSTQQVETNFFKQTDIALSHKIDDQFIFMAHITDMSDIMGKNFLNFIREDVLHCCIESSHFRIGNCSLSLPSHNKKCLQATKSFLGGSKYCAMGS